MKLEVKVNFDFGKMAQALPKAIDDYTKEYVKDSAMQTKKNIDSSKDKFGKPLKIQYRDGQPLKLTGEMYNSIKQNKNSLSIKEYGYYHDQGLVKTVKGSSNTSNFISTSPENKNKIDDKFMQSVRKALRK
jgi:hypothetical protein|tara:strand:+ start:346 stop:738 length:393 start_codon:yes stop_codon:yes gene_type:complete